jgi:hypothetical protein
MKLPALALPNRENLNDTIVVLSDCTKMSATDFFRIIGGVQGIRLMVSSENLASGQPQVTSQKFENEEIYCISFESGKDRSGRVTSAALLVRKKDIPNLNSLEFGRCLNLAGLTFDHPISDVENLIQSYDLRRMLSLKKKS